MARDVRSQAMMRTSVAVTIAALVTACGGVASGVRGATSGLARVTVPHADRFTPFSTLVTAGSLVTFYNGDADTHTVVSVPGDPLNMQLTLLPGHSATVLVSAFGTHRFFCSIHAHYDPATGQIAANTNADHPDEPMEGLIAVAAAAI
jgi:plastocyanin